MNVRIIRYDERKEVTLVDTVFTITGQKVYFESTGKEDRDLYCIEVMQRSVELDRGFI